MTGNIHNPLQSLEIGLGTWQWGDRFFWGFGNGYWEDDLRASFDATVAAGIRLFDTAEVYGQGRSEQYLGQFLRASGQRAFVATKFMPFPWRLGKGSLRSALNGSLRRLALSSIDLYQIHWPFPPMPIETWMDALADGVEAGLIRAAGVSNYNGRETLRAHEALKERGVPLASNQIPYNLLDRRIEKSGLLGLCRELGVRVIAYSPLAQGLLTGKYTPNNPPPGARRGRYRRVLPKLEPIIALLRRIGEEGGRTPAQVALNWCICKGTLPIPGAKNARQAEQNAGAVGWRLTEEEVEELDRVSDGARRET